MHKSKVMRATIKYLSIFICLSMISLTSCSTTKIKCPGFGSSSINHKMIKRSINGKVHSKKRTEKVITNKYEESYHACVMF